jgi:hypothetical protein
MEHVDEKMVEQIEEEEEEEGYNHTITSYLDRVHCSFEFALLQSLLLFEQKLLLLLQFGLQCTDLF